MEPVLIIHEGKHYVLKMKKDILTYSEVTRTLTIQAKIQVIEFFPNRKV